VHGAQRHQQALEGINLVCPRPPQPETCPKLTQVERCCSTAVQAGSMASKGRKGRSGGPRSAWLTSAPMRSIWVSMICFAVGGGRLVCVGVLREPAERVAGHPVQPGHVDEVGTDVEQLAELVSSGVVAGEGAAHELRVAAR
jgi:hypothetical protein